MRPLSKWAEWIRFTLECLSYIIVIGGVFLFFWQQREARHAQRIDTAMLFVSLENSEAYMGARQTLEAPWRGFDVEAFMQSRPSESGIAAMKLRVTRDVPDDAVERVADFYSSVIGCRNQRICDDTVIDQFFRNTVNGFYCAYDVRLRRIGRRLNRHSYADDLRIYAGTCR